jgi:hypothetical protein
MPLFKVLAGSTLEDVTDTDLGWKAGIIGLPTPP